MTSRAPDSTQEHRPAAGLRVYSTALAPKTAVKIRWQPSPDTAGAAYFISSLMWAQAFFISAVRRFSSAAPTRSSLP